MSHPMKELLDHMLAKAPETKGIDGKAVKAFSAQMYFIGNTVAGAVTTGPVPGTFMILTPGKDQRTGQDIMVGRMFCPENLLYMDVMVSEGPRIVVPPPKD
jgi:hypothetical protein